MYFVITQKKVYLKSDPEKKLLKYLDRIDGLDEEKIRELSSKNNAAKEPVIKELKNFKKPELLCLTTKLEIDSKEENTVKELLEMIENKLNG